MPDTTEFVGKVAIVTGAGQGMGRAVARRLSAGGASLVLNDVNAEAAEEAATEIRSGGHEALAAQGDVASSQDVRRVVDATLDRYSNVHILINNAGVLRPTPVIDIGEAEWDLVVNVNLKGTYLCSRAVLPAMQQAGWGRIVNFSSTAGKNVSTVGGAHYTSAKAGVLGFTRHLAKEAARYGITVNAVCPGLIDTEMVRATISDEQTRAYAESFPIARLGGPEEVAELVAFLASDRAAYITGASLDINGGDLMI
ncbi:MAG: 2-hydroxycyclohexanecarboxyl-CoA dehydrogenase [Dehalococcoidia bacterium]|nr:2-hydroxycyclohexanecarboxyl-CoA dehydrogenase [Dehalococcoidia bacterium]